MTRGEPARIRSTQPAVAGRRRWSGPGPWFHGRPALTVAVAASMFIAVLGLRFAADSVEDPVILLFCLPVALVAVAFGLRGGLLAGLTGILLITAWGGVRHVDLSVADWATRTAPLILLGVLLGDAVDRLRRSEHERRRLAEAAERHREAVELNDGVVQGIAAAKWALEAGRGERSLEILDQTLETAQQLVSDLLREADRSVDRVPTRPPAR